MLTPTITSHWSDGKRIHVTGYFGGKAGDTYLVDENGAGNGSQVNWPPEIKSGKPVIMVLSTPFGISSVNYYNVLWFTLEDNVPYISIWDWQTSTEIDNETDISDRRVSFYAIFHQFTGIKG